MQKEKKRIIKNQPTYSICNGCTHGRNKGHGSAITVLDHLLSHRLRSHEDAGDVDFEHGVGVLCGVLERTGFLLNASGGHQPIHPALLVRDALDKLVEARHIADVDLAVVQRRAQLVGRAALDAVEVFGWLGQSVQTVYWIGVNRFHVSPRRPEPTLCVYSRAFASNDGREDLPVAPASQSPSACTRPRPRAAPVTRTTLSLSANSGRRFVVPRYVAGW